MRKLHLRNVTFYRLVKDDYHSSIKVFFFPSSRAHNEVLKRIFLAATSLIWGDMVHKHSEGYLWVCSNLLWMCCRYGHKMQDDIYKHWSVIFTFKRGFDTVWNLMSFTVHVHIPRYSSFIWLISFENDCFNVCKQ